MLKSIFVLIFCFVCMSTSAQIKFSNPGLEGIPGDNVAPYLWHICSYSPDINPIGACCPEYISAFEGGTYAGLGTYTVINAHESIGQKLSCSLIKGKEHHFTLYAYRIQYVLSQDGQIELWGGHQLCSKKKFLWKADVTNTSWQRFDVSFIPDDNYEYILFRSSPCDTCEMAYIGIDALSDITVEGVTFSAAGSIAASRDTICNNTPVILTVTGGSEKLHWQQSLTGAAFTDIANEDSTTYTAPLSQTTYFRTYADADYCSDTSEVIKVVVAPSPVAAFSYINDSLQTSFNSDSSKGAISYEWDFGDGTKSSEANPVHTFSSIDFVYHVCLTVTNGSNCSFTVCHNTNEVIGIEKSKVKSQKIKVYPNPAGNELTVSGLVVGVSGEITVTDLLGRVLNKTEIAPLISNFKLQTSNYPSGVYFLHVKSGNQIVVRKFIKQ